MGDRQILTGVFDGSCIICFFIILCIHLMAILSLVRIWHILKKSIHICGFNR